MNSGKKKPLVKPVDKNTSDTLLKKKHFSNSSLLNEDDTYKLLHELETKKLELELQNEELRKAKELAESAHRLLIQNLNAGIVIHAPDSSILLANDQASKLLGLSQDHHIGKTGSDETWYLTRNDETYLPVNEYPVEQVIATLKPIHNMEAGFYKHSSKNIVWVLINAFPEFDAEAQLKQVVVTYTDISSQRKAKEALLESEQKFRLLHELAGLGMGYFTPDGDVISFNKLAAQHMNGKPEDFEGLSIYSLYSKSDADNYLGRIRKSAISEIAMEYEDHVELPSGTKWFSSIYTRVVDSAGLVVGIQIISNDITEQKRVEESLRFNQFAVDHMSDAAFYTNAGGDFIYVNEAACLLLGYTKDELLRMNSMDIAAKDPGFKWATHFQELRKHGKLSFEVFLTSKSGKLIPVEIHANYVTFGGEEYKCGFVTDITRRHKAEKDLKAEELRVRAITECTQDAILLMDPDGNISFLNPATEQIFGYPAAELMGKKLYEMLAPTRFNSIYEASFSAYQQTGKGNRIDRIIELEGKHKKGYGIPVELSLSSLELSDGRYTVGIFRDITRRKLAEKRIVESEANARAIMESTEDIIVLLDKEGLIIDCNESLAKFVGYSRSKIIGKNIFELLMPDVTRNRKELVNQVFETGKPVQSKDFSNGRWKEFSIFPVFVKNHLPVRVAVFSRDITERVNAEETILVTASRLNRAELAAKSGNWEIYTDTNQVIASAGARELYGFTKGVFDNDSAKQIPLPEYRAMLDSAMHDLINKNKPYDLEYKIKTFDSGIIKDIHSIAEFDAKKRIVFGVISDITEQKRTEAALNESVEMYRTLLAKIPDGVYKSTHEGKFVDVNPAMVKILGYNSKDELLAIDISKDLYFDENDRRSLTLEAMRNELEVFRIRKKDGSEIWVEDNGWYTNSQSGETLFHEGVLRDVTARIQADEELRETKDYLENLLNYAYSPIIVWDTDFRIIKFNKAFERLTGRKEEDVINNSIDIIFPQRTRAQSMENIKKASSGNRLEVVEMEIMHFEGSVFTLLWNSSYTLGSDGKTIVASIAQGYDISERKQALNQLIESEELWHKIIDTSPDCIAISDLDGTLSFASQKGLAMWGLDSESDWLGRTILEFIEETYQAKAVEYMNLQLQGKLSGPADFLMLRKDGSSFYAEVNSEILRDATGNPKSLLYIIRDISDRKHAEEALLESDELNRQLLQTIPFGMEIVDENGNVLFLSEKLKQFFGHDATGEKCWMLYCDDKKKCTHCPLNQGIVIGETSTYEADNFMGGRTFSISNTGILFQGKKAMLEIFQDITDRKRAQEEVIRLNAELEQRVLDRTSQLEAANKDLEAFSYSVSHDLRTPLRALDGFANILLEDYAGILDAEGKRMLKIIISNANNMGRLIDDLLAFSRLGRKEISYSKINMREMAKAVYNELSSESDKETISFNLLEIPSASGDPAMIRQIWVNLISNAIKFTSKKTGRRIEIGFTSTKGEKVYYVKDNGAGFEMAKSKHIFGVFKRMHSAKDFDGTGVGLAIVKRIVQRHKGNVSAEGIVNEGVTVTFSIPARK